MASTSKAFNKCVDPCPRYLRWHTQSLRLLFGQGARTRCPWGENLCATSSTFAGRRHMIGKVVTGCVAILPYHTATQDRGSECRDFGFISRIVTALIYIYIYIVVCIEEKHECLNCTQMCASKKKKKWKSHCCSSVCYSIRLSKCLFFHTYLH